VKVPIKLIRVPDGRQRTQFTEAGIGSLATSLAKVGQLHPLYVRVRESDDGFDLISGYRRLMAARKLGWEEIWVETTEKADPLELEEMELDENLQRENLSWQEEVAAKKRLMDLRAEKYGDDYRAVAEHVGEGRGTFWEDVKIAEALEEMPELAQSKNKTAAMNKIRLKKRREGLIEKASAGTFSGALYENYAGKVKLGNCLEIMKGWNNGCAQLIVTDPPYGINLDSGDTKKGNPHPQVYEDDPGAVMDLVYLAAKECYRLLISDAHAYFFFDIKAYPKVFSLLTDVGFLVDPIPLIWVKNQSGQVNHPDSRFGSAYEACFFCRKGSRALLKQGVSNVLKIDVVPSGKKIHPTEKPVSLLQALIEFSSVPGETIVDPFGGSGSTAEAAVRSGRNFLTIEKDPGFHAGIIERLARIDSGQVAGMSAEEEEDWGIDND
jgi:site-specific DNA-methyltransferase (adenine-specific)